MPDETRSNGETGTPFFSVVIPTRNRATLIVRAIDSALLQDFNDFEIVIVDNGSTDGTEQVIANYNDPRIRYFWQKNAGASAGRNRGAELARGRYVAFLDSDDAFLPGKLSAFHRAITGSEADEQSTVWYSPLYFDRGVGNRLCKPGRAIGPDEPVGDYLFTYEGTITATAMVMPRDLYLRVKFDPDFKNMEDLDFYLRLEAAGGHFRMLPEPQAVWYDDHGSDGRLSYSLTGDDVMNWLASERHMLSDRAQRGFLARYWVPIMVRRRPLKSMYLLTDATIHGSVSPSRALSLFFRGLAPMTYNRLRDSLVARGNMRGQDAGPIIAGNVQTGLPTREGQIS